MAQQVEGEETVGRLREAERGVQIRFDLGVQVQHTVGVANELEVALQRRQVGGGEGRDGARPRRRAERAQQARHDRQPALGWKQLPGRHSVASRWLLVAGYWFAGASRGNLMRGARRGQRTNNQRLATRRFVALQSADVRQYLL